MKRHPLDVPEGTVFANTLAAAKPSPLAFRKAIERLERYLKEGVPWQEPIEIVPPERDA